MQTSPSGHLVKIFEFSEVVIIMNVDRNHMLSLSIYEGFIVHRKFSNFELEADILSIDTILPN